MKQKYLLHNRKEDCMRSNKGYTLVELIVAIGVLLLVMAEVGALMINSQTLYKNGYYEVNLQENSQQIVQTVQDLLMNANVDFSLSTTTYTSPAGHKSDVISFKTKERVRSGDTYTGAMEEVTYKIGRRIDLVPGTTPRTGNVGEYTDLVLVRSAGDGETVSLIAEGVQSIYLTKNNDIEVTSDDDMFNVKTADIVSISMNMVNENYRYSTSGEVYLRNRIGTGGDPDNDSGSGSNADCDVTVLRIHEYDLKKFVPKEYTKFVLKDSSMGSIYDLEENGEIKCNGYMNCHWELEKEAEIIASSAGGGTYKILVKTPKVNDGAHMPVYSWTNTTTAKGGMNNAIPVNGICTCPDCVDDLTMDAQITIAIGNGGDYIIEQGGSPTKVDLAVLATNGEHGFTIKRHHDDDVDEPIGSGVPAWNCSATMTNEVFNRVHEGELLDIESMHLSICPMIKDDSSTDTHDIWETDITKTYQYRNLQYKYLLFSKGNPADPYAYPTGTGGQHCMYLPHPGSEGANVFANFTLGRIHVDNKANGFSVRSIVHSDAGKYYWDYMIENKSYIRLHIWCSYAGKGGIPADDSDYTYTYDCYGYYFPQNQGTDTQHDFVMGLITETPSPTDVKPVKTSDDPYPYEYYDM